MTPLASLRAEAEALSRQLPGLALQSGASEAIHVGSAGRRRAGSGESFWQYRRYAHEDSADRIDWRRSAKGDQHFVRETELETARTVLFWCDADPGFDWKGEGERRTKADEARVLMMALGAMLSRDGERIGVLGSERKPSFGKRAIDRLGEDLANGHGKPFPPPPRQQATLIVASDFYDPVETWQDRLAPLAAICPEGILLSVAAPIEKEFPFEGRVKLQRPGTTLDRILGRAETLRETYLERFAAQQAAMISLAEQLGWRFVAHDTGQRAIEGAAALQRALESLGSRT